MTPHDNFMAGARIARQLAAEYRTEASETPDIHRREICLWEAEHAEERADYYEFKASLYAPKEVRKEAA